jgi:hypothetical protein
VSAQPDVVLVAAGSVTINRWGKEPTRVPLRTHRRYDRFAAALGETLGQEIAVVEQVDEAGRAVVIVPALDGLDEGDPARTVLLEATAKDLVHVMRRDFLGAVTWEAMDAWRADPAASANEALFGRAAVADRMTMVSLTRPRAGYAFFSSTEPVPALVGGYLRAVAASD